MSNITASTPTGPSQPPSLGQQLLATLSDVTQLIADTNDPTQIAVLSDQRTDLLNKIGALVDTNLDAASAEYSAATAALQSASDGINAAIKGLQAVAKAVALIAKALDLVDQLIP